MTALRKTRGGTECTGLSIQPPLKMPQVQTSLEELERIIHWQQWTLKLTGINVHSADFKFNPQAMITIIVAGIFTAVHIIDMFIFRDDVFNLTFVLITFCYCIIGWIRLLSGLKESKSISSLVTTAVATHKHVFGDQQEQNILNRFIKLLKQAVLIYTGMFVGGCVMAGLLPLAIYLWNGEVLLPYGIILPFVDPATRLGYQINYIYQIFCILYFPPEIAATQNMYFVLVFNICIEYDMLMLKLNELDKLIFNNKDGRLNDTIHEKLADIVRYHQRVNDFVTKFEELYSYQLFLEISIDALQIIITLFVLHIDFWMPGYLVIVVATFQLFLYCLLGTLIEIKTDSFSKRIYSINWYKLTKKEQKNIGFALRTSQKPRQLTYGGFTSLNVNFFLSIYKKIYSVFMMLQNMNE
ncbi:putative odorant receptor 83c [Sabethes cyaneus]|uniref:putative odorant receptor 83c n=1 Tax=Sabethes cyaneus TaxID=53552 RepID=UPI00237DB93A|nr:putative odorant receptor 83c [Sabethes cyaneus]